MDEYVCTHCGSLFHFVNPAQQTVTTDVVLRNCLHCGNPIQSGTGFQCTRCGKKYFCSSCVDRAKDRNVCYECIATSKENCQSCSKYAVYRCANCGRKACKDHASYVGFIEKRQQVDFFSGQAHEENSVYYCQACAGFICRSCVKKGFFSSAPSCPKCGSQLNQHSPYQ